MGCCCSCECNTFLWLQIADALAFLYNLKLKFNKSCQSVASESQDITPMPINHGEPQAVPYGGQQTAHAGVGYSRDHNG